MFTLKARRNTKYSNYLCFKELNMLWKCIFYQVSSGVIFLLVQSWVDQWRRQSGTTQPCLHPGSWSPGPAVSGECCQWRRRGLRDASQDCSSACQMGPKISKKKLRNETKVIKIKLLIAIPDNKINSLFLLNNIFAGISLFMITTTENQS